ncbi:unnamed protein product, partial [Medioppia subpectinata]
NVNAFVVKDGNDFYDEVRKSRDFTGKVVLVTGSAYGIGEAVTKLYSALGAEVVVTSHKKTDIDRVVKEVKALSPKGLEPLGVVADLTKEADIKALFEQTIKKYGKLDVLVNNAGLYRKANITEDTFEAELETSEKIDIIASVKLIRYFLPYLEKTKGNIISLTSVFTEHLQTNKIGYEVAKAGLEIITKGLALELAPKGIRVNCVSPGIALTPPVGSDPYEVAFYKKTADLTPLYRRAGAPQDIAKAVVFLSSTDAQFVTGNNLVVDGGLRYNMASDFLWDVTKYQ